jgi:hypothetical protein
VHTQWFYAFLGKLLEADRPALRMLRHDPFDGTPPRWVRVLTYHYRFSTREEFRRTRLRWIREQRREVIPPVSRPQPRAS